MKIKGRKEGREADKCVCVGWGGNKLSGALGMTLDFLGLGFLSNAGAVSLLPANLQKEGSNPSFYLVGVQSVLAAWM